MDAILKQKLSETLHYFASDAGEVQGGWDAQKDEYKQKMATLAERVDRALTTLNQTVVRIDAPQVPGSFEQTMLPQMIAFMTDFLKGVKHPKGVADLFPTEELARQLILKFAYQPKTAVTVVKEETTTEGIPLSTVDVSPVKVKRIPTAAQLAFYNRGKKNAATDKV